MHGLLPPDELNRRADALSAETGNEVDRVSADLTDYERVYAMIDDLEAKHGKIDILVNNAGIQHMGAVKDYPEDKWRQLMAILLDAPFYASKAVLPGMLDRGWGRIVNTGSMHALVASPFKAPYNAAKHGVAGFTKTLALEVAKSGITVNCVCPGFVETELVRKQLKDQAETRGVSVEEVVDIMLADQPIGRFIKPEEIGGLVRHLCTEEAGAITGACLSVDGGWVAR